MRVLIIGGSGHVGRLITPRLLTEPFGAHDITVFDRDEPAYPGVQFVRGDLLTPGDLQNALPPAPAMGEPNTSDYAAPFDDVLYLAMPHNNMGEHERVVTSFSVNAGGVWLACEAARRARVRRFVYASSLSVHEDCLTRPLPDEENAPADAQNLYGITKRFGEEVLERFAARGAFDVAWALRLCFPVETKDDALRLSRDENHRRDCALTGDETARAFHLALTAPPPPTPHGFAPVFIVGAHAAGARVGVERARTLLGWAPDAAAQNT